MGVSVGVDELLASAAVLRSLLSSFDPRSLQGPECVRVTEALAATEKACAAVRLVTATCAVDAGAHLSLGFGDGAAWLASQSGSSVHQAKRDLEVAGRLEDCAETRDAFVSGTISKDQAIVIAETAAGRPSLERQLVHQARHCDLSKLRDTARQARQADTTPDDLHAQQQKARSFKHWRDPLGMVCFSGRLTPEVGVPLLSRLEQTTARRKRQARTAGARPDDLEKWDAYAADALAELCAPTSTAKRSARTELVIVCDLHAWRRGHTHPGEVCHIIDGGPIPVDLAKELGQDAFLKTALYEGTNIHTVKHFGRHYPAPLRTALDLGPVPAFTGRQCAQCGSRWHLEYDHINPLDNHGPTSYHNIQALCWADHQTKTRQDQAAGLTRSRPRPANPPPDP